MTNLKDHVVGSEILRAKQRPDPNDDVSQDAAENRKPPLGFGLSEKIEQERSETDKSDLKSAAQHNPEDDARGQSVENHDDGYDEVSSANSRVISRQEIGKTTFATKGTSHDDRKG